MSEIHGADRKSQGRAAGEHNCALSKVCVLCEIIHFQNEIHGWLKQNEESEVRRTEQNISRAMDREEVEFYWEYCSIYVWDVNEV
jgi:hypothetical protein